MCDWIEQEIAGIAETNVRPMPYEIGEFDTIVPGAVASLRIQRMVTRLLALIEDGEETMRTALAASGILLIGMPDDWSEFLPLLSRDAAKRVCGMLTRTSSLENAVCDNIMHEHDLWHVAMVGVASDWRIFYRTLEQAASADAAALVQTLEETEGETSEGSLELEDEGDGPPFTPMPDDPSVN